MRPIKVLIVDDSMLVRQLLTKLLSVEPQLEVVGSACDPFEAREMIKQLHPDVLTLDVEMPKMDGITFLKNLMRLRPMPVVMLSTLTTKGANVTLEALELGAVDFIAKPKSEQLLGNLNVFKQRIIDKVILAASVELSILRPQKIHITTPVQVNPEVSSNTIIAMGASTGGTEALRQVLVKMPSNSPAVVITQHIPPSFSLSFAKRLNAHCQMEVYEAQTGQKIERGQIYVAPGGQHLKIRERGGDYYCQLEDSEPVNRHKPSVDVMFGSLVQLKRVKVYGVLLTGMGKDGAAGMLALKQAGHFTLIQDQKSSLIWGMPGSAFAINAHCEQSSLDNVASKLITRINQDAKINSRSFNV